MWLLVSDVFPMFNAQVDLLRGPKSDKLDVTLQPEDLDNLEDALQTRYVSLQVYDWSFHLQSL